MNEEKSSWQAKRNYKSMWIRNGSLNCVAAQFGDSSY